MEYVFTDMWSHWVVKTLVCIVSIHNKIVVMNAVLNQFLLDVFAK